MQNEENNKEKEWEKNVLDVLFRRRCVIYLKNISWEEVANAN